VKGKLRLFKTVTADLQNVKSEMPPADAVLRDGFTVVPHVLTGAEAAALGDALAVFVAESDGAGSRRRRGDSVFGVRNLLAECKAVRIVARHNAVRSCVAALLGPDCFAVRALLFDKTPGANWRVPFHQDLSIAVAERVDRDGWGPWSEKAGVLHVQPPCGVLEAMLTIRLHLDPCGPENGPLRVLPATHNRGKLSPDAIADARACITENVCTVAATGGAVLMRPLLLHASSPAQLPGRRRVLHIEYAAASALPPGLAWHDAV